FRNMGDAELDDSMGGEIGDVLSFVENLAVARLQEAGNSFQGGRFASAIRADESYDCALLNGKRDALERRDDAIVHDQVFDFEHQMFTLRARNERETRI